MANRQITFSVTRRAKVLGVDADDVVSVVQEATESNQYAVIVKNGVIGWVMPAQLETVKIVKGNSPTIDETIAFIKAAHAGQVTKGGEPYWTHPVAVMELLPSDVSDDERHAALLHDVLEDCEVTRDDLARMGYSNETIEVVEAVTRDVGKDRPSYMDWIRAIAASGNLAAIRVKTADILHNMQPDRIANLPPEQRDIVKRYEMASRILRAALSN